ncbi:MAG: hypothetical protein FJ104_03770 [Deltaproteobacteria bacterium]|nr:hypothetical protein [Deltaproteobacteria bacterium]
MSILRGLVGPTALTAALALVPLEASAQVPGAAGDAGWARDARARARAHLPFRDSVVSFDTALSARTVGLAPSPQTANPTLESTASFRPRWHLTDDPAAGVFLAGRVDVTRELTDSDVTTRRGETLLSDTALIAAYRRVLRAEGAYLTFLQVAAPSITLPTSKFSYSNGTYLGLGTSARVSQRLPLIGLESPSLGAVIVSLAAGYDHTFTRAVVPTDPELRRVRLTPEGRTAPGDQLTAAAFPEHEMRADLGLSLPLAPRLDLGGVLSYRPQIKYDLGKVEVCTVTGCADVPRDPDRSRVVVLTVFQAQLQYQVEDEFSVALGYANLAVQPGPDGEHRNPFSSPGAQVYLTLFGHLDALYQAVVPPPPEDPPPAQRPRR